MIISQPFELVMDYGRQDPVRLLSLIDHSSYTILHVFHECSTPHFLCVSLELGLTLFKIAFVLGSMLM